MKKNIALKITASALIFCSTLAYADNKVKYISPNNDGIHDELVIPLKISDKRLITAWQLVITDEKQNIIRTIGNKTALPAKLTFKSFFKQLGTAKKGIDIPSSVSWNGVMDNGETAPDGKYFYYFSATDDNDNTGKTKTYSVVVDTLAPQISLKQPADKIFGEGAKSELKIKQSGSSEDKWTGTFKNNSGIIVKTYSWDNGEPLDFSWNGSSDIGNFVTDGVYSYEISSTDKAGNKSQPAAITNIIYSAEKPATNIIISSARYFSPQTDSNLSSINFIVQIPVPASSSGNKLTAWKIAIAGLDGKVYRVYDQTSSENPPKELSFDGLDNNGKLLPQGKYQALITASYLNGFETDLIKSPEFILDRTKPSAQIGISDKIFGAGAKSKVTISMLSDNTGKFAEIPAWTGKIYSESSDKPVRTYDFGKFLPDSIDWNGFASNGNLAPDGKYKFELAASDLAGNKAVIVSKDSFELNTKAAKLLLSMSDLAFSPGTDSVKKSMKFTPVLKDADGISSWTLQIKNSTGSVVKTVSENGTLPASLVWDGKAQDGIIAKDGMYSASLTVNSTNGSQASASTQNFALDTIKPSLSAATPWSAFSPDNDGSQDIMPVEITECSQENIWLAQIKNAAGKTIKTYTWNGKISTNGKDGFAWDGSDESGNITSDGMYSIEISSEDAAGNKFATKLANLTLDSRETKAYLTSEYEGISPNADNFLDTQKFSIRTTVSDGISWWNFDIKREDGTVVRNWSSKDSTNLPASITWDGLNSEGYVAEGTFTGNLQINYSKGNKVSAISAPFICTATQPQLSVKTAPKYFSPDNDGTDDDLFIRLSGTSKAMIESWKFSINDPRGNVFWQISGKNTITERLVWDGLSNTQKDSNGMAERVQSAMDYPYTFTVKDNLGMTSTVSGVIPIDILVIRDGSVLKMAVPSIIFRSDNADFKTEAEVPNGLKADVAEKNEVILKRVAEILNKFKDYNITIVGHANRMTDNEAEETEANPNSWGPALIPLSKDRAEFVKSYLLKKGVSSSRLTTDGKGGTELVADYKDRNNNWKNRRVEFILNK